jgi:hypothetical protein
MDIDKIIKIANREETYIETIAILYMLSENPARNAKGKQTDKEFARAYLDNNYFIESKLDQLKDLEYLDENYNVIPRVQKWFYKEVNNYAKEIWDLYPRKLKVGDNEFISKNLSLAKFSQRFKAKNLSEEQQKLVLEITDWAVKNNELKVGMIKFLELDLWESLYQDMMSKTNKAKHMSNLTIL